MVGRDGGPGGALETGDGVRRRAGRVPGIGVVVVLALGARLVGAPGVAGRVRRARVRRARVRPVDGARTRRLAGKGVGGPVTGPTGPGGLLTAGLMGGGRRGSGGAAGGTRTGTLAGRRGSGRT